MKKEVTTLHLETTATRSYPFARQTLDEIRELRQKREGELLEETGKEHLVPAPIIIADAVHLLHQQTFNKE